MRLSELAELIVQRELRLEVLSTRRVFRNLAAGLVSRATRKAVSV